MRPKQKSFTCIVFEFLPPSPEPKTASRVTRGRRPTAILRETRSGRPQLWSVRGPGHVCRGGRSSAPWAAHPRPVAKFPRARSDGRPLFVVDGACCCPSPLSLPLAVIGRHPAISRYRHQGSVMRMSRWSRVFLRLPVVAARNISSWYPCMAGHVLT